MRSDLIQRIHWHCSRNTMASGWPGLAAASLLVACPIFFLLLLKPMQQEFISLKQAVAALGAAPASATGLPGAPAMAPGSAAELAHFYQSFPRQDELPDAMARLFERASQHALHLDQADYQLKVGHDDELVRQEIVLPVKGSYVQVRKFAAQALADMPNLSLDHISFSRGKIGDPLVDAQIRFSFYLRPE